MLLPARLWCMYRISFARLSWVFARSRANHFTFLVWIFHLFIPSFHSFSSKFRLECCHDFSFQPFYMASVGILFSEFTISKIFFFSSVFRLLQPLRCSSLIFCFEIILPLPRFVLFLFIEDSWFISSSTIGAALTRCRQCKLVVTPVENLSENLLF